MIAVLNLSPQADAVRARLQRIATFLRDVNADWIREQLAAGLRPPLAVHSASPPWTQGGAVHYVTHHGDDELAELRHYYDGPTLFARRKATCIDIGAYDAAARTVLLRQPTDVFVLPRLEDPRRTHVWIGAPGSPRERLLDATAAFHKVGA